MATAAQQLTQQLPLFLDDPLVVAMETIRSPLCIYEKHCGSRACLGPPDDRGGCVNREIRCLSCGRDGVQSTRTT